MPGLRPRRAGNALVLTRTPVSPSAPDNGVGAPIDSFAAKWLAFPCRRFVPGLAADSAWLGASAVRYAFTLVDWLHLLLPASRRTVTGIPGALAKGRGENGPKFAENQRFVKHQLTFL